MASGSAVAGCCQNLTAFDGSIGWNFSRFVSGTYGRPITGSTMEYGNKSVCGSTKRHDLVNSSYNGCSGPVTWREASNFCEGAGGRLCTLAELEADETHGSGCNYDYQHIWSSTPCEICPTTAAAYFTQWGYSAVARDGTVRTPPQCNAATRLAFARCCADSCPGFDPEAEYNRIASIIRGETRSPTGGCASLTDDLGYWPETNASATATRFCPGSTVDVITRPCLANGTWLHKDLVDTSACRAPRACDVCNCYPCGGNGQRLCGAAAVGIQTSTRSNEFFADCAHKFLVVAPRDYPTRTTRIDLQGNTMLRMFEPDSFNNCINVWQIYMAGLLRVTAFPPNVFSGFERLEIMDTADLQLLTAVPPGTFRPLVRLRTFIMHFWGIDSLEAQPFNTCSELQSFEISSSPSFTPRDDLFVGALSLEVVTFSGNPQLTSIPSGLFAPLNESFRKLVLRYNHRLASVPPRMLARTSNAAAVPANIDITENVRLTTIGTSTFSGIGSVADLSLGASLAALEISDGAFERLGSIQRLTIVGLDLAASRPETFRGLGNAASVELVGMAVDVEAQPMPDNDPFKFLRSVEELNILGVQVATLSPGLFASLTMLVELQLRCVPISTLTRDLFSPRNTALKTVRATELDRLSSLGPYLFLGVPNLERVDLSQNPSLTSLGTNVFDGAFKTTQNTRARVVMAENSLTVISKRAFNFDSAGMAQSSIITLSSAASSRGLRTCCGYDWLIIDRHFAVPDLACINTANESVLLSSAESTAHCCVADADLSAMRELRHFSSNPNVDSFTSLPLEARMNITRLCENANWTVRESQPVRACGPACTDSTQPTRAFRKVLQPNATSCVAELTACPQGYRIELAGPLQLLVCEPWLHTHLPRYETSHFVGELACEPCGVIGCWKCDASARLCEECASGAALHTNASGSICLSTCPAGYHSVLQNGMQKCTLGEDSAGSSGVSIESLAASLVFAIIICIVVMSVIMWRHRQKSVKSRRRRRLVYYIRVLAGVESVPDSRYNKALESARDDVIDDVQTYSPHLNEKCGYRRSISGMGQRRSLRRGSSPSVIPHDDVQFEVKKHELNGAVFLAIETDSQSLIPALIARGADGCMFHPDSGKLPVTQLLTTPGVRGVDVPVVNFNALDALLRAYKLDFDDALGQVLRRRRQVVRLVDDFGEGYCIAVDIESRLSRWANTNVTSTDDDDSDNSTLRRRPRRKDSGGSMSLSRVSQFSSRENEGYVTVNAAIIACLKGMAADRWTSQDGRRDTVVQRILVGCQLGRLSESIGMDFIDAVLQVDPGLLTAVNARGDSPQSIALACHGLPRIEECFTIVLYKHFQLISPGRPKYKSPTALIHEVRDLRRSDEEGDMERLVIKLMQDEESWAREIELRSGKDFSHTDVVALKSAATLLDDFSCDATVPVECCPYLPNTVRLQSTRELLQAFPFALVMPMADRNLAEVIQSERLADESIDVLRQVGSRICAAIHGLHQMGVVHGDLKPRNIVREGANTWKLIDLDMSFPWRREMAIGPGRVSSHRDHANNSQLGCAGSRSSTTPLPVTEHFDLASTVKLKRSTAYQCPELLSYAYAAVDELDQAATDVEKCLATPLRIDIWSFGAIMYEIASGLPLCENQYDRATASAEDLLGHWSGLNSLHITTIEAVHGPKESASLIDLLRWLLEPDPAQRPADLAGVMAHLFFNPKHGKMREHSAIEHIRSLLRERDYDRPCVRVMISYSWDDSAFVLNRLAPELAPVVEDLWLDRLGGEHGMGEWTRLSMERGVSGAEVVIAVVSPSYVKSDSCGYELALCHKYKKTLIPIMKGIPSSEWPPTRVGKTDMKDQFRDSKSGDMRLYVNFTDAEEFAIKFDAELLPRLQKRKKSRAWAIARKSFRQSSNDSLDRSTTFRRRTAPDGLVPAKSRGQVQGMHSDGTTRYRGEPHLYTVTDPSELSRTFASVDESSDRTLVGKHGHGAAGNGVSVTGEVGRRVAIASAAHHSQVATESPALFAPLEEVSDDGSVETLVDARSARDGVGDLACSTDGSPASCLGKGSQNGEAMSKIAHAVPVEEPTEGADEDGKTDVSFDVRAVQSAV